MPAGRALSTTLQAWQVRSLRVGGESEGEDMVLATVGAHRPRLCPSPLPAPCTKASGLTQRRPWLVPSQYGQDLASHTAG